MSLFDKWGNQKEEIATIKPRTITLNLSDADCYRLAQKSGGCGLSVSELLENFIGDLVDGTYSNGSDERMNANAWFERCGFSWLFDKNLLTYLIEWGNINNFLEELHDLEEAQESVSYWVSNATTKEDVETLEEEKEYLADLQGVIDEYINEYFQDNPNHKSKEEELESVIKWREEMEVLINGKAADTPQNDKMTEPENKYYTIYEVANIAGVEHHTIRRHIKEGLLKATKQGGRAWQVEENDLKEYLKGR
ncbi:MAG: helix-turn-helix domain-containing protein [Phascolarctobacterium sp.]|nr:helix-turn-helix domain-containing protein [Candidatus Phascolarctobacterium caballi]